MKDCKLDIYCVVKYVNIILISIIMNELIVFLIVIVKFFDKVDLMFKVFEKID